MKKLIVSIVTACFAVVGYCNTNTTNSAGIYDVFNFKATVKVPYLMSGVRTYKTQSFVGIMTMYYTDYNTPVDTVKIVMTNKKTKVEHVINVTDGFLNMLGKKMTTPTVACISDSIISTAIGAHENHESIKMITFAGTGSTKKMKIADATGCDSCGAGGSDAEYCYKVSKINGYTTGYMNCECPDGFTHTMQAAACGNGIEPMHEAAFWGSWTASRNAKLSFIVE